MSDEMKKLLQEALASLLDSVRAGASFAQQQMPLLVQEKLRYELWRSAGWAILVLAGAGLVAYLCMQLRRRARRDPNKSDREEMLIVGWGFGVVLPTVMVLISLDYLQKMLKIIVAPRVYILDWLRSLI